MLLRWSQFAAVAAFVALQAGLPFALAAEEGEAEQQIARDNRQFWDGFTQGAMLARLSQDWFGGFGGFLGPMSSMLNFLDPRRQSAGTTISMQFDQSDKKSCQLLVITPEHVKPSDVRVAFEPSYRTVGASYHSEERREVHDPQRGDSVSSRSVSGSSTMGLPEKCLASAGVVMSQHAGVVFAEKRAAGEPLLMIVFPSRESLEEHVNEGRLPADIVTRIESGGEVGLAGLTEQQLCLASGFTLAQCEKIDRKPRVASVPAADSASSGIPMPVFDVTLEML